MFGSVPHLCKRNNPEARFSLSRYPVFSGVERAFNYEYERSYFTQDCFGFGAHLADEPDKKHVVMSMVDAIASDEQLYLSAVRGSPEAASALVGREYSEYWLFPMSRLDWSLGIDSRIKASIERQVNDPAGNYYSDRRKPIVFPFDEPSPLYNPEVAATIQEYRSLTLKLQLALLRMVLEPVVRGGASLDVVDEYREYYYSNGGERLEQIINEWRIDG